MDTDKKQDLSNKQAEKYKTIDSLRKEQLERRKETYNCDSKNITLDSCIQQFKKEIREGPYYVCCVCNRALYRKSVLKLIPNSYPCQDIFSIQTSFDGKQYICKTCYSKAI